MKFLRIFFKLVLKSSKDGDSLVAVVKGFLYLQPWVLLAVFAARILLASGQLIPAHTQGQCPESCSPAITAAGVISPQVKGGFICLSLLPPLGH
uniref:Uncharacterized protein n=1 Tax=Geospiza parvula TaxID=87175 RepID=A0A8U8AMQ3_GEOPR